MTEDTSNAAFFKPHKDSIPALENFQKKFLCIDDDELKLKGNYDTVNGRIIQIVFKRCIGEEYCWSDEAFKQFISHRYLVLFTN